jgi:hypothetical protein
MRIRMIYLVPTAIPQRAAAALCAPLVIADDDPIARMLLDSSLASEFEVVGILEVAPNTAIVMLFGHRADGVVREPIEAGRSPTAARALPRARWPRL